MTTWSDIIKHGIASIFKRMLGVNRWAYWAVTYLQFNRHTVCCLTHWWRCYIHCVFFDTVKRSKYISLNTIKMWSRKWCSKWPIKSNQIALGYTCYDDKLLA